MLSQCVCVYCVCRTNTTRSIYLLPRRANVVYRVSQKTGSTTCDCCARKIVLYVGLLLATQPGVKIGLAIIIQTISYILMASGLPKLGTPCPIYEHNTISAVRDLLFVWVLVYARFTFIFGLRLGAMAPQRKPHASNRPKYTTHLNWHSLQIKRKRYDLDRRTA